MGSFFVFTLASAVGSALPYTEQCKTTPKSGQEKEKNSTISSSTALSIAAEVFLWSVG
jgi:hypothetical protein